ncbi:MAG: endonuclease I [Planctomycetota bacterium]|jgi:endonuclease I
MLHKTPFRTAFSALSLTLLVAGSASQAWAQGSYYNSVDTTNAATLRTTLHQVIDDHTRFPYTSGSTDTWDILRLAQEDQQDSSRIIDVYRNRSFAKTSGSYNREHTWPKSYGFPDDGPTNSPYTDCHLLWLSDGGYNSDRSNKPFGSCSGSCTERTTDNTNGVGGGSGVYPGNSNWTSGSFTSGIWEVNVLRRGDIARTLFYADVRYEGGSHGGTGFSEPDLILSDNLGLIAGSSTGSNESVAYMGRLAVLLQWHYADPVDDFERRKNVVVASFQGNRNPFVDHPEWIDCLFGGACAPMLGDVYCSPSVANSTGAPATIEARGSALIADLDFRLLAGQLPNNSLGYFLCSETAGFISQPGGSVGNLCLSGSIGRVVGGQILNSGFFGGFATDVDLTSLPQPAGAVAVMSGETWHFQAWFRDAIGGQATSNFTDGWQITFQ